jgi:patatin-like phospholipase/acyl hydrolase
MAENFKAAQPKGSTGKRLTILSIDGGGVRGIIPAVLLTELEKILQELDGPDSRLVDYFDLVAGTSTGSLIASMITIPNPKDPTRPRFCATDVTEVYINKASTIFPPSSWPFGQLWKTIVSLFGPKYSAKGLESVLETQLGDDPLSIPLTSVIIPSFDINIQQPVFFSSWQAKRNPLENPPLKLVCQASTAAPTYLPAVQFSFPDHPAPHIREFNMVDGGVAVNNPTYVGITQAVKEVKSGGPCAERVTYKNFSDLLVLSLGTGTSPTGYSAKDAAKWGALKWVLNNGSSPLINSAFDASADMVDYNLSIMFDSHESGLNYLRIQTDALSGTLAELDNATPQNLAKLQALADSLLDARVSERNFLTGKITPIPKAGSNRDALHRFARWLSEERKARKANPPAA